MALDRMEVRLAVSKAVRDAEAARERHYEEHAAEKAALQEAVDDARAALRTAQEALQEFYSRSAKQVDAATRLLLAGAVSEHSDLITDEDDGVTPILCEATGLAMFEDDGYYGDLTSGNAVLKEAVVIVAGLPSAEGADEA